MGSRYYLYQQILGLSSPWKVVDVRLVVEGQADHISVEHGSANHFRCPKCDSEFGCYDLSGPQPLDSFMPFLRFGNPPRYILSSSDPSMIFTTCPSPSLGVAGLNIMRQPSVPAIDYLFVGIPTGFCCPTNGAASSHCKT